MERAIHRVTTNLPTDLLDDACSITGKGITETIAFGLELVRRSAALDKARKLKGKLVLEVNLSQSRERT
jgi:hypothetical protein